MSETRKNQTLKFNVPPRGYKEISAIRKQHKTMETAKNRPYTRKKTNAGKPKRVKPAPPMTARDAKYTRTKVDTHICVSTNNHFDLSSICIESMRPKDKDDSLEDLLTDINV